MPFSDLLRMTVFLTAAEATALGAVTALVAARTQDSLTLAVGGGWWLIAAAIGLFMGRPQATAEGVRNALAGAKTAISLPPEPAGRIALERLWPIGGTALLAGALGFFFPGVPAIGCGYALLVALAWRNRERAVLAVEERDGVRFYVEPGSALRPIQLVRTPGLGRDRPKPGRPPPPAH